MHVRSSPVPARVNAETANELRMLELHNLYCESNHSTVECRVLSIAICIHDDVGGVAVLMLAVAGRARNMTVVRRCSKAGVDVESQSKRRIGSVPSSNLGNDELELVEQSRAHCCIAWPRLLIIVSQKITDLEMLAHWKIDVVFAHLEKSFRRWLLTFDFFREVSPDSITVEHRPIFFLEGNEHCDGESFDDTLLVTIRKREAIEPGLVWNAHCCADQRSCRFGRHRFAEAYPFVPETCRIAVNIERIFDVRRRHRESHHHTAARSKRRGRWFSEWKFFCEISSERFYRKRRDAIPELKGADCGTNQ